MIEIYIVTTAVDFACKKLRLFGTSDGKHVGGRITTPETSRIVNRRIVALTFKLTSRLSHAACIRE